VPLVAFGGARSLGRRLDRLANDRRERRDRHDGPARPTAPQPVSTFTLLSALER
jgi:hypothetical protein